MKLVKGKKAIESYKQENGETLVDALYQSERGYIYPAIIVFTKKDFGAKRNE